MSRRRIQTEKGGLRLGTESELDDRYADLFPVAYAEPTNAEFVGKTEAVDILAMAR